MGLNKLLRKLRREANRPVDRDSDQILQAAFENEQSDLYVRGKGGVEKVLPDDLKGSRHQNFILRLGSGQTLLVSHNIDVAPYIKGLKKGSRIAFKGEYEWNAQGGIVHWTHKDPRHQHPDGWIKFRGRYYE